MLFEIFLFVCLFLFCFVFFFFFNFVSFYGMDMFGLILCGLIAIIMIIIFVFWWILLLFDHSYNTKAILAAKEKNPFS
jgi:hypothetical protein